MEMKTNYYLSKRCLYVTEESEMNKQNSNTMKKGL